MPDEITRWTMIERAATGSRDGREEFARRYSPVIHTYLETRWRKTSLRRNVEDAAQQVFVECFKTGGALERAQPDRPAGFRGYLFGIMRNVALTFERKQARSKERQPDSAIDLAAIASREESLTQVFDRAWARAVLGEAADLQLERARASGPDAVRRHRLLALRFGEGRPIREIAERWGVEAAVLHREYAKARQEFRRAMHEVVQNRQGAGSDGVHAELERLRSYFS